jgi:hypothetical protein
MSLNPSSPDTKEINLSTFGGLVTNMNPVSLPMGVSPDCSDCTFLPGGVFQRPCLRKAFTSALGTSTFVYGKTYVDPQNVIRNLYLDTLGNLWMENITTSAVPVIIAVTTPGSFAKSITAFGREYIAVSDGLHGQEVPLQYDGTNLDRVTQDGPGAPPTVASIALPSVAMVSSGAPLVLTVVEADPEGPDGSGFFTSINLYTSSAVTGVTVGDPVTIAGNSTINGGPFTVLAIYPGTPNSLIQLSAYLDPSTVFGLGGTATIPGSTMTRQENVVTVTTATPHQLQIGYQAQITGIPATVISNGVTSIVINNEDLPGIATVTTLAAHGLVPGAVVGLRGVYAVSVGNGITAVSLVNQVASVTTATAHGLQPGAVVSLLGTASLDGTVIVTQVPSSTVFCFTSVGANVTLGSGGHVFLIWPVPDADIPPQYEVIAAPTPLTFQIAVSYTDGTWTTGIVSFAWDGIFYVNGVSMPATPGGTDFTVFTYQQYGPNATTSSVGTVTPHGQVAPGLKQVRVSFLTRQGAVTAPSPPTKVVCNGGQYLSVTNLPIGPSNVVARIIELTGAEGAYFFYIPAPPQVNGQIVGTATQINDNTSTSVLLDFGDPTLFAALGTSIPGNNLANQIVLDSALGFGYYGSRLMTYGQRNVVQNFLNLGFDGGHTVHVPAQLADTIPLGWTDDDSSGTGMLATGHYGTGWQITVTPSAPKGPLSQTAYEDYSGAPILQPDTQYRLRVWLKPSAIHADVVFWAIFASVSTSFSINAQILGSAMSTAGSWVEATFSAKTPVTIPSDMTLQIYATSTASTVTLLVDEINFIYAESPYLTGLYSSYVNNPEGVDGVTGLFGPEDDTHPVMDVAIIRSIFYMLTQDPEGRIHETTQGTTEPSLWTINEVAANCGTVSAFSLTRSQADDASAAGGEEWFAWYSSTGPRIFGGNQPDKIAQEIQRPAGQVFPGAPQDLGAINPAALLTVWGLNNPESKQLWFGIPTGVATTPTIIYMLSYLGMDSAESIAAGAPVHQSITGKISARDLNRKWAPWKLPINGAALMLRGTGQLVPVFFGGRNAGSGTGQVYTLDPSKNTDDDYGVMAPYYVTCAFPDHDQEQALGLGGFQKMIAYTATFLPSGIGNVLISILPETLAGTWPLNSGLYPLRATAKSQYEWSGGNCQAEFFFFKYTFTPLTGSTDVAFALASLTVAMKKATHIPVRGALPG